MEKELLIGIDAGGTYIRVAVSDYTGKILSHVKYKGGAFGRKSTNAKENMCRAISIALENAKCTLGQVGAICAGIAGYDSEDDICWVNELTNFSELDCPKVHVNDAVVAHRGALLIKSGIIAVSGTGAIIYGITENKQHVRNYDFNHRAKTGAPHITYNFVHRVLAGDDNETDKEILEKLLAHFSVENITELAWLCACKYKNNEQEKIEVFGEFAKHITNAACEGSELAKAVCQQAAFEIATGIKMLGTCFAEDKVNVALAGSVANSEFIRTQIEKNLLNAKNKEFILNNSGIQAELGAIIIAMEKIGIELTEEILFNLKQVDSTDIIHY